MKSFPAEIPCPVGHESCETGIDAALSLTDEEEVGAAEIGEAGGRPFSSPKVT